MDTFTIITGLASLIGAGISIVQAIKAKNSAEIANNAKKEIIERTKTQDYSVIHSETKNLINEIRKIGPTATVDKIKGINKDELAEKTLSFTIFLNEQSELYDEDVSNVITKLCNDLKDHIEKLSNTTSNKDILESGKTIFYLLNGFLPKSKELIERQKMK